MQNEDPGLSESQPRNAQTNQPSDPAAPNQPAAQVASFSVPTPPVNSTHPVQTSGNAFMTGSQLQQTKPKLPVGIYIIAGINLLGFTVSFFDTSQTSAIFTFALLADLLLGIGLIMRQEIARKLMVWLSAGIVVLSILSIFLLISLQSKVSQLRADYQAAVSKISQSNLTVAQQKQLNAIQAEVAAGEKKTGKVITFAYAKNAFSIVKSTIVIVYLVRPKVKDVFETLEP